MMKVIRPGDLFVARHPDGYVAAWLNDEKLIRIQNGECLIFITEHVPGPAGVFLTQAGYVVWINVALISVGDMSNRGLERV